MLAKSAGESDRVKVTEGGGQRRGQQIQLIQASMNTYYRVRVGEKAKLTRRTLYKHQPLSMSQWCEQWSGLVNVPNHVNLVIFRMTS